MLTITKEILNNLEPLREKINEDVEYMILYYDILNSKDHWSCICSAMDWIDVAKENIDSEEIDLKNFKFMWKDVYSYLSAVDIIIDAISQIYRAVFKKPKKIDVFNNSNDVFGGEYLNMSDYDFFKHMRAVFGAHPVKVKEDNVYKFASWPCSRFMMGTDKDVLVYLYSSDKDYSHKQVGFNFNDINKLLKKFTEILPNIYDEIENKKEEFYNKKKSEIISKNSNPIEQIKILADENNKRFNNGYIDEILKNLEFIFSTPITNRKNQKLVNKYQKQLCKGLVEIYDSLQNMNQKDLKIYEDLNPNYDSKKGFGYAYGKLTSMALSDSYSFPFGIIKEDIENTIKNNIELDYSSEKELYVLVLTSLYFNQNCI